MSRLKLLSTNAMTSQRESFKCDRSMANWKRIFERCLLAYVLSSRIYVFACDSSKLYILYESRYQFFSNATPRLSAKRYSSDRQRSLRVPRASARKDSDSADKQGNVARERVARISRYRIDSQFVPLHAKLSAYLRNRRSWTIDAESVADPTAVITVPYFGCAIILTNVIVQ